MNKYFFLAAALLLSACGQGDHAHREQQNGQAAAQLPGEWIEVMPANPGIVQGMALDSGGKASSIGMATLQYERWKAEDDRLILWGKSIGNGQTIDFSDTLTIVRLTADSLLLDKFGMYRVQYYRR